MFPASEVMHLIRQGSDHAPPHLICNPEQKLIRKPFKFLNFWTKHQTFRAIVRENWIVKFAGSLFYMLLAKLKKVKHALAKWNKEAFGDVFHQIVTKDDIIHVKEMQMEID